MSGNKPNSADWSLDSPFEEALKALVSGWRETGKCSQSDKALIRALAERIPPYRRAVLLQGFEHELAAPSPRGGPLFERVVHLIQEHPRWTAARLRRELEARGTPVDVKALSNCLHYLVKSGRLIRISRGHYEVAGFGIVTSDELIPPNDIPKGGENED